MIQLVSKDLSAAALAQLVKLQSLVDAEITFVNKSQKH